MGSVNTTGGATGTASTIPGTISAFLGATDPEGWVILDGRAISTISDQKIVDGLTALGITGNLPDYRDRALYGSADTSVTGIVGGRKEFTMTKETTANYNLTGNTNTTGSSHSHTVKSVGTSWQSTTHGKSSGNSLNKPKNIVDKKTSGGGAHTHGISLPTGGGAKAINLAYRNIRVNWILKVI